MNSLALRIAAAEDAHLLSELGAATFQETFAGSNSAPNMAAYLRENFVRERVAEEISDPLSTFLIAEISEKPVGYAKMRRSDPPVGVNGSNPLELVRLYVLSAQIGKGVGAALMRACLHEAERRGHGTLWLGVWEKNSRALDFYRKWGFENVGSHIFQLGSDAQTDFILQKRLTA